MTRDVDRDDGRAHAPEPMERFELPKAREARPAPEKPFPSRERQAVQERGFIGRISEAERETMRQVGQFRTVAVVDLMRNRYRGKAGDLRDDLRSLSAQGLVQLRTAWIGRRQGKLNVVVLTRQGKELLERERPASSSQAFYSGFVKRSEVAHDAAIYRMFQAEAARIEKRGGTIRRVVLDYEFKKSLYSPLAKAKSLPPAEYARRQAAVAQANGLKVVDGKIPLPDLRIEYETRDGEAARVDLELATEHYHGSHLKAKAEAGFTFYAAEGSAGRLTRVLEEREITAVILSL